MCPVDHGEMEFFRLIVIKKDHQWELIAYVKVEICKNAS
jgi:hypothetical protein